MSTPRLVATSGPLEGATFQIKDEALSIGRDEGNLIRVDDRSVSRRHCLIEQVDNRVHLRDLGSHNRTFVNNLPVDEHWLQHGDDIRIGHSRFLFLEREDELAAQFTPGGAEEGTLSSTTVILRREDAVYLDPQNAVKRVSQTGRAVRDLKSLLQVGEAMSSERSLRPLADRLLTIIEEAIPAEDTAVLLQQSGEDSFLEFRGPKKRDETVAQLPRGILRRVVKERISVSINEVQGTDVEDLSKSVVALKLNSILAVPLITRGRVIGVIYAAARDTSVRFDEDHLQLLTGIAGLAAGGLENMLHLETLKDENRELQARINAPQDLVGDSPCIANVHKFITRVAPTPTTVLITGESGTGKELVARAIHRNSPRHPKPFVAINCATLTETLLESELFGHEKGAFTGAIAQKRGKLETAEGGTVFLDEIGEMPLNLQAKLLRVLQEREFERLGGTRPIKVDIRLIAATNRNLAEMAKTGGFREDLYYRLNVVSITTPPLRQHREDIPVLARYFVEKHEHIAARRVTGISAEALDYLMRYDWPGNVRELQNVIERALVMGSTEYLLPDDLPESVLEVGSSGPATVDFHEQVNESKRRIILSALEQFGGNYTEAAKQLGIHPNNLHRLIRNLNLKAALKK